MPAPAVGAAVDLSAVLDWPFERIPLSALQGSVSDRFDAVARRFPSRLALDDGVRTFTYSELALLANCIAAATVAATKDQQGPVAVLFGHEARFPAAILGVMAAGRICVPLDAEYPTTRNQMIARHAGAVAVVSVGELAGSARELFPNLPVIDIETLPRINEAIRHSQPKPDDIAYILYTSGSTGTPKGVYQNHRGVIRDIMQCVDAQHLSCEDRVALFYSPTVASGFRIALSALLVGASVHCLRPHDLGGVGLAEAIRGKGVTIFRAVAALFRHVVEALRESERLDSLRLVVLGGDRVDWSDFDLFKRSCAAHARFGVHLGATEVSLYLEWYVDETVRATSRLLPVGRAVLDRTTLLLGEDGQPVADAEIGEFAVSSRYIALGYWPPSELSAPFSLDPADSQARLYRTGDLGRRRPDGLYEHVGRKDHQIKLHGYRIEPAEIEAALKDCSGVRDAAIVVRRDEAGVPLAMMGYVEFRPGVSASAPSYLLAGLARHLPRHMVPSSLHVIDQLPRLPSHKIDRVRLAEIDIERTQTRRLHQTRDDTNFSSDTYIAVRNDLIEALSKATGKLNKPATMQRVNQPESSILIADLGLDSLHSIAWCLEIQARTGVEVAADDLVEVDSLHELVGLVLHRQNKDRPTGVRSAGGTGMSRRVRRDKPWPLSFAQERIWKYHSQNPKAYALGMSDEILGPLDIEVLLECLSAIVERHEILRTTFQLVEGLPAQIVHAAKPVALPVIELSPGSDLEEETAHVIQAELPKVCDLACAPLARFSLLRVNDVHHRLLRVYPHILADAWSTEVLLGELAALYEARLEGQVLQRPEPAPVQYADYAAWQRRTFHPGSVAYEQTIEWWKQRFMPSWPALALPFKRQSPITGLHPDDGRVRLRVDAGLAQRLDQLRRGRTTTVYVIWLSTLVALLSAQTNQSELAIGAYVTTRRRPDLQNVVGDFTSLAILGFRCDLTMSFHDWLDEVRHCVAQTEQHSAIPHDLLRNDVPGLPQVEIIFGEAMDYGRSRTFANLTMRRLKPVRIPSMPWGFSLSADRSPEGQSCVAYFDAGIHDPAAVRHFWVVSSNFLISFLVNPISNSMKHGNS